MTIDETSVIRDQYLADEVSTESKALFLMGYIQALRDMRELAEKGSGSCSETIVILCSEKEKTATESLRKL